MIVDCVKSRKFSKSFDKPITVTREELLERVIRWTEFDLKCEFHSVQVREYHWLPDTEDEKTYTINYELTFIHRTWTGPRVGNQLIHARHITPKTLAEIPDVYHREMEFGTEFVKSGIPNAVRRIGCTCCYGTGPDLDIIFRNEDSETLVIEFWVDFDFVPEELN